MVSAQQGETAVAWLEQDWMYTSKWLPVWALVSMQSHQRPYGLPFEDCDSRKSLKTPQRPKNYLSFMIVLPLVQPDILIREQNKTQGLEKYLKVIFFKISCHLKEWSRTGLVKDGPKYLMFGGWSLCVHIQNKPLEYTPVTHSNCKTKLPLPLKWVWRLDMVALGRQSQADFSGFKAFVIYTMSCRTSRAI